MAIRTLFNRCVLVAALALPTALHAAETRDALAAETRDALAALDITTFAEPERADARRVLGRDASARLREAGNRESAAWRDLKSRADWEAYAKPRVERMRAALNVPGGPRVPPRVVVTKSTAGDGWVVECVAYESRPGLVVTANLYRPATPGTSMPGIVLSHSHHNPKTESELRDMGVGWARAGCCVLVPDHLGHGQRRQHPFASAADFPKPFRAGRQDYYYRYVSSLQLYAAGETLMGWMAHDLSAAVDVLLARPGVDPKRIALLGSVAGGGDPAAVAAALDPRIAAVAPFNFGGPQPETRFPLPDDAETWFNYTGGGSWESTRNLYRSAADGFLPWVIVGSVAPRALVYGHEFSWDKPRDPVWKRLETVWGWYGEPTLGSATGRGNLSGRPPEASHCNNIGPVQRKDVAAWLKRAANIPEPVDGGGRPNGEDLVADPAAGGLPLIPLHEVLAKSAGARGRAEADRLVKLTPAERVAAVRAAWTKLLGDVEPAAEPRVEWLTSAMAGRVEVRQAVVRPERGLAVPVTLLSGGGFKSKAPAVVMFAQRGKQKLLAARSAEVTALLDAGVVVCLADLRGFGETAPGSGRDRGS
ncbi:MAG TPA: acetylxylan esterase, partial [Humisphaera sp.]